MGKIKFTKGFTLIELLVVISIISLLSSIIMAALNSARNKAKESAIKSELLSIKSQAELSYNNTGDYSTASSAISNMTSVINNIGGTSAFYTEDNTRFAVSVKSNFDPTKNWSVSDQGKVVVWDTADQSSSMNWYNASTACFNSGGRLPTIEEYRALYNAYGYPPFGYNWRWTGTEYPDVIPQAWTLAPYGGNTSPAWKTSTLLVRCVH
jgi:prepilin-type N-terminal cleavage/methylation domain-containing protein